MKGCCDVFKILKWQIDVTVRFLIVSVVCWRWFFLIYTIKRIVTFCTLYIFDNDFSLKLCGIFLWSHLSHVDKYSNINATFVEAFLSVLPKNLKIVLNFCGTNYTCSQNPCNRFSTVKDKLIFLIWVKKRKNVTFLQPVSSVEQTSLKVKYFIEFEQNTT